MSAYPIAETAAAAAALNEPLARTAEEASRLLGGPADLRIEAAPGRFPGPKQAEAAYPRLYQDPRFELGFVDGGWRVLVRYWRLSPPAPVGRTALEAAQAPMAAVRLKAEAEEALGTGAVLVRERLPMSYATVGRARVRWGPLHDRGVVELIGDDDGRIRVEVRYWRPVVELAPGAMSPAERQHLAARAAAPLRSALPQGSPFIGLFEQLAPENPGIVLAEEGDGRFRGID